MLHFKKITILFCLFLVTSCATSDTELRENGRSELYILGFHDGRHSGMNEEGNSFEYYVRDENKFRNNSEYRSGWLAGESEGKALQLQATQYGNTTANIYSGVRVNEEANKQRDVDDISKKVLKKIDATKLKALEK